MRFLNTLIITACFALLPITSFSDNTNSSSMFQVIQDQFVLNKTTVQSASIVENKDGTFSGLNLKIAPAKSKDFIQLTQANIGKKMNLIVNNKIISSSTIMTALGNQFLITGITKQEAQAIIDSLK